MSGFIVFILVLSVLVFVHELGHFSVARYFGVTVHQFSIGFGPKLVSKYWKGTNWSISLIPLGGYVQMKGQEDLDPTKTSMEKDSYSILTPSKRILVLLAGPFANFILAFFLYIFVGLMEHNELGNQIGGVLKDSPAYQGGLRDGDKVIAINDEKVVIWSDLQSTIKSHEDERLYVTVERNSTTYTFAVVPKILETKNMFGENEQRKMIGIAPGNIVSISFTFFESISYGVNKTIESSKLIFQGLQKLLQGIVPSSEVGGVISIGKVISDASDTGIVSLFIIGALISVNLGVLNLLPIPALDGGHIMFNIYELITKRKPSTKVLLNLTIGGWVVLLGLMALGLYNDINRFF
ncbi:MAG: RIP metalloprotease RseP [Arcobacteraceae bacterium]|nr:RIP metalloprotease RseP [Arcobacteraceae bacterium]